MMPSTASSSRAASGPNSSQSLRPRNKRLISGLSDDEDDGAFTSAPAAAAVSGSGARLASPRVTPLGSPGRSVSPIPSPHPSRRNSRRKGAGSAIGQGSAAGGAGGAGNFNTLWGSSWSTLQGLASNVLGSEVRDGDGSGAQGKARLRRPLELTHGKRRVAGSSAPPATQWGPSGQATLDIGGGSKEERDAAVRVRKRKDLLNAGVYNAPDASGRFKRRMSDDQTATAGIGGAVHGVQEDMDGDALVYVHQISPEDTLSGIAIRYNCPAQILRKANRMWAHDSVQTRKTLVLPVDACGVKGKPVSGPLVEGTEEEDLMQFRDLTPRKEKDNPIDELPNGWHPKDRHAENSQLRPNDGAVAPSTTASSIGADADPPWKHDSWVLLPNETAPTEIARLARRALGYFPPARRKSISYSDAGDRASPGVSFDLPRQPSSPLVVSSTSTSDPSTVTDPETRAALDRVRGGAPSGGARSARSSSMASSSAAVAPLPKWLTGPGGVGTLDRTTRTPGPAPDSLNRILGPHLPDVRPPPGTTFLPPPAFPSILDEDFEGGVVSSFRTGAYGRYSGGGGSGSGSFTDSGGVDFARSLSGVETWVRKMATRSYAALGEGSPASSGAVGRSSSRGRAAANTGTGSAGAAVIPLAAGGGVGDLIELMEPFEFGSGGGGSSEFGNHGDGDSWNGLSGGAAPGPEVRIHSAPDESWRVAAAHGSARPSAPAGMSRRVGRSTERKSGKDD